MSTPQPPPPVDLGNELLAEGPAQLAVTPVQTPAGPRLALTVRTNSATLTVFLQKADAVQWANMLAGKAGGMSASGLVTAPPNGFSPRGQG